MVVACPLEVAVGDASVTDRKLLQHPMLDDRTLAWLSQLAPVGKVVVSFVQELLLMACV